MAVCSLVSLSQVEYLRFDADFYHPQYIQELEVWRKLDKHFGIAKLSHLVSRPVRTGRTPFSRHIRDDDENIVFIKTDGVREGIINFDSAGVLPKRVLNSSDFISPDSVVVTIIGATPEIIGRTAIIRGSDPLCVTNQNIAVISTNIKCDPYFLTAFFQTKLGRDQLWRHSRRTEQVNLNCREVERVLILLPDISIQKSIGDMVRSSFTATDDSQLLYTQAQQFLELTLGIDKLRFDKSVGYTAQFSELELSRRADPEYFDPVAASIVAKITEFDHIMLGSSFAVGNGFPWHSKKFLSDNSGEPVVRIRNIRPTHIDVDELTSIDRDYARKVGFSKANKGEIVIGMDGLKYFYASVLEGDCYINQRVAHLKPLSNAKISSEYATFIINSRVGQTQLLRDMTIATTVGHITNRNIAKLVIPYVSDKFHDEITSLVRTSINKKQESKQLLDQAKSRVEQLIEEAVQS
jgi:type I restriction enzyme S subunit